MKITKVFHSCVLIEDKGEKILLDPGSWLFEENIAKISDFINVDAVLVTHEHVDHFYSLALDEIQKNGAKIITNNSIVSKLKEMGIKSEVLLPGGITDVSGFSIKALDCPHGRMPINVPENTGFVINDRIFNPGDSISNSDIQGIQALLAPIVAPWMKLTETIEFVKSIKPKVVVPLHDGFMKYPFVLNTFTKVITELGIEVLAKNPGECLEI